VGDAGMTTAKPIASDVDDAFTIGDEQKYFPGWVDEDTLYYFTRRNVYGTAGSAVHLVVIGADGKNKQFVQPDIDFGVQQASISPARK
jgi:hypothetical protein